MTQKPQTRRQYLQRTGGVALTAIGATGLAATHSASAETDASSVLAETFGDVELDISAFVSGYASRYSGGYGGPDDVDDLAEQARNEFEANADSWIDYGNWLLDENDLSAAGSATVGVTFEITRWRWPTRNESTETTVHVDHDDTADEFTNLEWTPDAADDPDFEIAVQDHAAENAHSELTDFRREYIDDGHEIPDNEWLNELGGRYSGSIGAGSETRSVLELLLGEVDVNAF